MENTFTIIDRVCARKRVEPRELLGHLLEILRSSHGLTVFEHRGKARTVLDEIAGHAQLNGRPQMPATVMAAVETMVQSQESCDRANAAEARKQTSAGVQTIEQKLAAEESLRLIMRELMNQTEHQMLDSSMRFDGMIGPDGKIDFNRPKTEPDRPMES